MHNQEWLQYIQYLQSYLHTQNLKIEEMRQMIQNLHNEINKLKENEPKPPVVRNEYKFDLLKIERLEGTLNIGLNPNGNDSSIGEFAVDQAMQVPQMPQGQAQGQGQSDSYQKIQEQIHTYLDKDAYHTLKKIEQNCSYPLDDPYRKFIVEDVKRQINQRIQHYIQKMQIETLTEERRSESEQEVVAKVRKDIDRTFEAFIRNLPRKESKSP